MIRIGIIGGIGSGKSFIARLFKYPVFNADKEVETIYKKNYDCYIKLKKKLPNFIQGFPVKKKELIQAISHNKKNLTKISSVVHPIVRNKLIIFLKKNKNKIVVLDIPLLIENRLNKSGDILIFVKSKQNKILNRLKNRTNYNLKLFKNLKENQVILSKKRRLANYIIDNNFSPNIMKKKIKLLKKRILYERSSS